MKCDLCGRDNLTEKELRIHLTIPIPAHRKNVGQAQKMSVGACPDCGATLFFQEGCSLCQSCGFSKCG